MTDPPPGCPWASLASLRARPEWQVAQSWQVCLVAPSLVRWRTVNHRGWDPCQKWGWREREGLGRLAAALVFGWWDEKGRAGSLGGSHRPLLDFRMSRGDALGAGKVLSEPSGVGKERMVRTSHKTTRNLGQHPQSPASVNRPAPLFCHSSSSHSLGGKRKGGQSRRGHVEEKRAEG